MAAVASKPAAVDVAQQNAIARALVLQQSVEMTQQIFGQTITPASSNVLNIQPRQVGLIKGFAVQVTATITNAAGSAATLTDFNIANLLQQVTFTDLSNNVRINTTGWHLFMIDSVKRKRIFGSVQAQDSPVKFGSNYSVMSGTASIAASGTGTVSCWFWVPLAYAHSDLRGAVYGNVVNATMNLQLTLAQTAGVASGDSTNSIYTGNAATVSSATVNVYQVYLDQLPMGKTGPVLPILDLSTVYELKNTTFTGLSPNAEYAVPLANFRDFISTIFVYYNGTARVGGTDINYWALQSANFTNIFKLSASLQALKTRNLISTDMPLGVTYFDHRERPLKTLNYGNLEYLLNPSVAGAGAYLLAGFEDFAYMNTVTQAGSLASA